jgi:hypothetical protein
LGSVSILLALALIKAKVIKVFAKQAGGGKKDEKKRIKGNKKEKYF